MKLKESNFKSQILGVEKEMAFSIESENSVIFDILRDKMYSDKIAAVCREVASNSRDANREAGKGDIPITIAIKEPNTYLSVSGMSITFQDSGNGISPSKMEDIFLKYGASTKRDTNNQTGGFGLGAKTPFAYNDTFTVITVCDVDGKRMEYVYSAMIDSSRKGKMVLFDSEETDKETGTKIIVPIKPEDKSDFEAECFKATCLWDNIPKYEGFYLEIPKVDLITSSSDLKVVDIKSGYLKNKTFILLIDGIPYPIENMNDVLKDEENNYAASADSQIIIPFNNGELTISANRESVQYDEDTVNAIKGKLKGYIDILKKSVKNIFKEINKKTYLESSFLFRDFKSGIKNTWSSCYDANADKLRAIHFISDDLSKFIKKNWISIENKFPRKFAKDHISLKYHKLIKFESFKDHYGKSSSRKKELYSITIKTMSDLNELYIIDSAKIRMDHRRNSTILDKTENRSFCMIVESDSYDNPKAVQEVQDLMDLFEIDLKFYKDVERAQIKRSPSGSIMKKDKWENKHIPFRLYADNYIQSLEQPQSTLYQTEVQMIDFFNNRDISKYCIYTIERLGDIKNGRIPSIVHSQMEFLYEEGICTIVVTQKNYDKYFKDFHSLHIDKIIKEESNKAKKIIEVGFDKIKGNFIKKKLPHAIIGNESLESILPKEFRELLHKRNPNISHINIDIIDKITGSQFNKRLEKLKLEYAKWEDDYALVLHYIGDHIWEITHKIHNYVSIINRSIKIANLIQADKESRKIEKFPKMAKRFQNKSKK